MPTTPTIPSTAEAVTSSSLIDALAQFHGYGSGTVLGVATVRYVTVTGTPTTVHVVVVRDDLGGVGWSTVLPGTRSLPEIGGRF